MKELLNSSVFNYTFDFDEWPSTSSNTVKLLVPYNNSIFKLRYEYPKLFPKLFRASQELEAFKLKNGTEKKEKVFKIKYQLNILTSMNNSQDGDLMDAIAKSHELPIYETESIMEMIDYKWDTYAFNQHKIGGFIHMIYVLVLIGYINHTFLVLEAKENPLHPGDLAYRINPEPDMLYLRIIAICLVYPIIYDGTQMFK